jgi:hypothetical protein
MNNHASILQNTGTLTHSMCVCVRACVRVCVRARVRACACACVRARVRVRVRLWTLNRKYQDRYLHVYMQNIEIEIHCKWKVHFIMERLMGSFSIILSDTRDKSCRYLNLQSAYTFRITTGPILNGVAWGMSRMEVTINFHTTLC